MGVAIAIVEDDASIRTMLEYYFKSLQYEVQAFGSGDEFLESARAFDLALLDVMLPGLDGVEVLRRLRGGAGGADMAVIMLTARTAEMDKVTGLDAGADDYITKPFGLMELQARVSAVLRRHQRSDGALKYQDLLLDPTGRTLTKAGVPVELTYKEFELLKLLISRKGAVLTRDEILLHVWGYEFAGETRTVDMHIKFLRQKLGDGYISTVRSVGYKLTN
jgi:two-component system alkaline phosphatase synthesis response regulator PhoP